MNAQTPIQPSIVAALAKALPELESAKKTKNNPAFKSKYADLAAVIDALEPIAKHGLWYRQHSHESADGVTVETLYIHTSGEQLSAGTLFMPATKKDAQGFGSALSYARRYALKTAFGLATEDDDGNAAVKAVQGQSRSGEVSPEQLVSDGDLEKIITLCSALGGTVQADILKGYGINQMPDLPASKVAGVLKRLGEKMADKAKAETNKHFGEMIDDEIPY